MSGRTRVCLDLTPNETIDRLGGIGRYTIALVRALLALREDDVELLGIARSDGEVLPLADALDEAGREEPLVSAAAHRNRRRFLLGAKLRAARVDLFHAAHPMSLPFAPGCRVVATFHDLVRIVCPPPGVRGRVDAVVHRARASMRVRQVARLVVPSETTRRDLVRELRVDEARIDVTPLGVDRGIFAKEGAQGERSTWSLPDKYFLAVASDHYRKNQGRLVEAFGRVASRLEESLVIVGRPLYGGALDAVATSASHVEWRKDVGDAELAALYRNATASVHPSLYEGFGMTVLESMSCGTPVIAARNGAYDEVGGDAAMYFDPREAAEIAGALVSVAEGEPLRRKMRDAGFARADAARWERTATSTVEAWRRAML